MFEAISPAPVPLSDRGYDADWFRQALAARGTSACIPSRKGRKAPIPHDAAHYRRRHRIENMFGSIRDWRRIHTRYDRCAHAFMSAIALAASVIFWINRWVLSLGLGLCSKNGGPNMREFPRIEGKIMVYWWYASMCVCAICLSVLYKMIYLRVATNRVPLLIAHLYSSVEPTR